MSIQHKDKRRKHLCDRLARAEGQLRGLQKLVQSDTEAEKIAQQMTAVRRALDKTFFAMVADLVAAGEESKTDIADLLLRFG
jgi:DNA-binding FrmR family transcriptional regulator